MEEKIIIIGNKKINFNFVLIAAVVIASLCVSFAAICFAMSNIKSFNKGGIPTSVAVVGEGEVSVSPDSATITVTIKESAPTSAASQSAVDNKAKNLNASLDELGIDKKDIRSLSYSTRTKYEVRTIQCETSPCQSKYEVVGYESMQTIQVKARKIELAGEIMAELGKLNINEIAGPNFAIEDSEKPKADARIAAIKNSKNRAEEIAKALGANLGKVIKFEEDDNLSKYPINFAQSAAIKSTSIAEKAKLSPGEDIIRAKVVITYSLE